MRETRKVDARYEWAAAASRGGLGGSKAASKCDSSAAAAKGTSGGERRRPPAASCEVATARGLFSAHIVFRAARGDRAPAPSACI
eukprot:2451281-Prymnesium_polylepis.1